MLSTFQFRYVFRFALVVVDGLDFLPGQLDVLWCSAVRRVVGVDTANVGDFCDHVVRHGEDSDADVLEAHACGIGQCKFCIEGEEKGKLGATYGLDRRTSANRDE